MKRDIKLEAFYPYPPERVWRAVADGKAMAKWLMPNDFEPTIGHKFQFRTQPRRVLTGSFIAKFWNWKNRAFCGSAGEAGRSTRT
jgi:uncharacterized protein YndB with AHSA1/START domain